MSILMPTHCTIKCFGFHAMGYMAFIIISVLSKVRSFTTNTGTKVAVLFKGRSSTANSGTKVAVLLG